MRNKNWAFLAVAGVTAVGGYFAWRNRYAIQRQLSGLGVSTPLLDGTLEKTAQSVVAETAHHMDRGATIAEHMVK